MPIFCTSSELSRRSTSGLRSEATVAACSVAMTSFGVFAGAVTPYQVPNS